MSGSRLVASGSSGLTTSLTSAHLFIGNNSNVATDTAVTGDVTISNTGVTTIGAAKVQSAMLQCPSYQGFAVNAPSTGSFTLTQGTSLGGSASVTSVTNAMQLIVPAGGSSDNNAILEVTPTGNFTLTISSYLLGPSSINGSYGLFVKDNIGKIVVFSQITDSANRNDASVYQKWTNINTFSTNAQRVGGMGPFRPLKQKLQLTGGNFVYSVSSDDGGTYVQIFSKSQTDFIGSTISSCGIWVDNNQGVAGGPTAYLNVFNYSLA